jgi:hypothetical protein
MQTLAYRHDLKALVEFTAAEVYQLFENALIHYDFKCKATARPGGILWGLRNVLTGGRSYWWCSSHDLDLLLKILEMPKADPHFYGRLQEQLRALIAEQAKNSNTPSVPEILYDDSVQVRLTRDEVKILRQLLNATPDPVGDTHVSKGTLAILEDEFTPVQHLFLAERAALVAEAVRLNAPPSILEKLVHTSN